VIHVNEEERQKKMQEIYDDLVSQPMDNLIMIMKENVYKKIMRNANLQDKQTIYGIKIIQVDDDNDIIEDDKVMVIKKSAFELLIESRIPSIKKIPGTGVNGI
jgi:hypothetical protein